MTRVRPIIIPLFTLAIALGITWLVWDHERQTSRQTLQAQFDFSLRETVSRIEQRMAGYEQMLRGVQGLFAATGTMDQSYFSGYVDSLQLDANFTGIQVVGVTEWLPAVRREAHMAAMHQREAYAPIIQVEPNIGINRTLHGLDRWADPIRRLAMEKARDSGKATISGKVGLVTDNEVNAQPGFIMYLPIYARGHPLDTVAERRNQLIGWVFAGFQTRKLMASLYGEQRPGLALALYDEVEATEAALLYRTVDVGNLKPVPAFTANEYLVVSGHTWMLTMSTLNDFETRNGRNFEWLIAIAGSGLSLLLAQLAWLLATGRARALQLAGAMTKELRESEQRWSFALEGAGDGVWDWNLQTRTAVNSRRWKEIVGDTAGVSSGMATIDSWEQRIHSDDRPLFLASMRACLTSTPVDNVTCVVECRIRKNDDQWKWVLLRGMIVERDLEGAPLRLIGTLTDISERKNIEEQVRQQALHDPLTNLPNRRLLKDRLNQAMAASKRSGCYGVLMFLDLDNFKSLNDGYGHEVGDLLLIEATHRLKSCVRGMDTVARFGGDEFVVMISELEATRVDAAVEASRLAEKIRVILSAPYFLTIRHEGTMDSIVEHHCTASIGLTLFHGYEASQDDILKWADTAMYQAKEAGRNLVQVASEKSLQGSVTENISTNLVPLTWHTGYECGHPLIDEQHRTMFVEANRLLAAILNKRSIEEVAELVGAIVRDIAQHFKDEEAILSETGFPGAPEHAAIHRQLLDKAAALASEFHEGTIAIDKLFRFLAFDLAAKHMLNADREFFPYLRIKL